jgi:hypothetical protein
VLSNRGLPGKLFADVEDAKHWLSSSGKRTDGAG